MSTIEERLQTLEQEHVQLTKTVELHSASIGALVNKTMLEKQNEKYDKLFEALMAHDRLTNVQLAELRTQQIEEDGKIVGLQTEMRQRFNEQDSKFAALDGKVAGLQTEMRQRFNEQDSKFAALDGKAAGLQTEMRQRFNEQGNKIASLDNKVAELDGKVAGLQTTQAEHTVLLQQILARLPEQS